MNDKNFIFLDETLPVEERVRDLRSRLTLDEKIKLLTSHHFPIERLGIGEWRVGTEIARGFVGRGTDKTSTVFPQPVGMAAMFDTELMQKIGDAAAAEARAYHRLEPETGLSVWGPTVDMVRDIRWGRTEESYGEDVYLAGEMTSAYTKGLRGDHKFYMKTIPTLKHFCANNNEETRTTCDANLEPRLKHEYYYAAFKPAITRGGAYSVMTAYNEINGAPAIMNPDLQKILKDEWGLGFIVSDGADFGETYRRHHTTGSHAESLALSLKAGCDCMTDISEIVHNAAHIALKKGLISEKDIDRAVFNALETRFRLGEFDKSCPYRDISMDVVDCDEHRQLNQTAALKGITLLKNDNLLPLSPNKSGRIAVIGALATENLPDWYTGLSTYNISVFDGIRTEYTNGSALCDSGWDWIALKASNGKYLSASADGKISATADKVGDNEIFELQDWGENWINLYNVKHKKFIRVHEDGTLHLNKRIVYDWFTRETLRKFRIGENFYFEEYMNNHRISVAKDGSISLTKNRTLLPETMFTIETIMSGVDRATKLAHSSDYVVYCTGNHPMQIARECYDRKTISLAPQQEEAAKAVFAANKNTILCLVSSYPYDISDLDEILPAIMWTSHAGPELGTAVARTIFGLNNPAGRTPLTWYKGTHEMPNITDYDIEKTKMTYLYYEGKPLYHFGYGLSYSSFEYSDLKVTQSGNGAFAELNVRNKSDVDGDEVVQIYFTASTSIPRPTKKLCGFKRVNIKSGECRQVCIPIPRYILEIFDVKRDQMIMEDCIYKFMVGASCNDIRLTAELRLNGEKIEPRQEREHISAVNYDEQQDCRIGFSKRLFEHYVVFNTSHATVKYDMIDFTDVTTLEMVASATVRSREIEVFSDDELIGKTLIEASDSFDDFKSYKIDLKPVEGLHSLRLVCGDQCCVYSIRVI